MYNPAKSNFAPVASVLAHEALLSPNCFSVTPDSIKEGIQVELNHPAVPRPRFEEPSKPVTTAAAFVGERYVKTNSKYGAFYQREEGTSTGLIRRATIEWLDTKGRYPMPLLTQPEGDTKKVLVHVTSELSNQFSFKDERLKGHYFSEAVETQGGVIMQHGHELMIEIADGDETLLYCRDGSVRRLVLRKGILSFDYMSHEDMAKERLMRLQFMIDKSIHGIENAATNEDYQRAVARRDSSMHEICMMMQLGGAQSDAIFDTCFHALASYGRDAQVRATAVRTHIEEVIKAVRPKRLDAMVEALLPSKFQEEYQYVPLPTSKERKGTPVARLTFMAQRAEWRRQNGPQKGPSLSKPNPHSSKKKGNK